MKRESSAFASNIYWLEAFYVGEHTDATGNTLTWTREDLQGIADRYTSHVSSGGSYAPVVLGHPRDDSPAYGVIKGVELRGDSMWFQVALSDAIKESVERGEYTERSVWFERVADGEWRIRHLGFLGGTPPALKNLSQGELPVDKNFKKMDKGDYSAFALKVNSRSYEILADSKNSSYNGRVNSMDEETRNEVQALIDASLSPVLESVADLRALVVSNGTAEESTGGDSGTAEESTGGGFSNDYSAEILELKKTNMLLIAKNKTDGFQSYLNSPEVARKLNKKLRDGFISQFKELVKNDAGFSSEQDESSSVKNLKSIIESLPDLIGAGRVATNDSAYSSTSASKGGLSVEDEVSQMVNSLK